MPDHECTFEPDPDLGVVLDDAVCTVCGRPLMEGYALDIDIDPAS
jgi:hypothetical protein